MKRKVVLTLAMSLDGFIADKEGNYNWIEGNGSASLDTPTKWDFAAFLQEVDTVVMGHNCYRQQMHEDFEEKQVYIASTQKYADYDNIHFINGDIVKITQDLQEKPGKNIYLFGGGKLISPFLKAKVVDEYIIGIIPVILGGGRPLFLHESPQIPLLLTNYQIENGIIVLHYLALDNK